MPTFRHSKRSLRCIWYVVFLLDIKTVRGVLSLRLTSWLSCCSEQMSRDKIIFVSLHGKITVLKMSPDFQLFLSQIHSDLLIAREKQHVTQWEDFMTEQRSKQAEVDEEHTKAVEKLRAQYAEMERGLARLSAFWERGPQQRQTNEKKLTSPAPAETPPTKPFSLRFKLSNIFDGTPLSEGGALSWSLPCFLEECRVFPVSSASKWSFEGEGVGGKRCPRARGWCGPVLLSIDYLRELTVSTGFLGKQFNSSFGRVDAGLSA